MPLGVEPSQQISIHALREEGDPGRCGQIGETHISIHALREEGDVLQSRLCIQAINFYPRPPRGGRLIIIRGVCRPLIFLSTPSARRATT